jgi:tetratricopeptide (TPR) repeat protein
VIAWVGEIEPLLPDIRDSLAWGLERNPVSAARAICRLRSFWRHRGGREHRTWLERALTHAGSLPDDVLADVLRSVGMARLFANDPEGAEEPLRESIERFNRLGDQVGADHAMTGYAQVLSSRGAHSDALALLEQVLARYRDIGYERAICNVLTMIGDEHRTLGDHERARASLNEAVALAQARGDSLAVCGAWLNLGDLELDRRKLDVAADSTSALSSSRLSWAPRESWPGASPDSPAWQRYEAIRVVPASCGAGQST